jgi:[ribosomal protein S18]-alanine N-acetyltransferase
MNIITITPENWTKSEITPNHISAFLVKALEQYGDEEQDILRCLHYALSKEPGKGGFTSIATENNEIVGAVVINETGMGGYIPENILVYIAVSPTQRGKGTGKKLMEEAISHAKGDIALHVEPDNPARRLYERLGFTNKYLEMRLKKS